MALYYQYFLLLTLTYLTISNGLTIGTYKVTHGLNGSYDTVDNEIPTKSKIVTRSIDDEDDPHYPYDEIENFVQNNKILKEYFNLYPRIPQIGNRDGLPDAGEGQEGICSVREQKILYPKRMRNIENVWRTIVNIPDKYEQGIETKECVSKGRCNHLDSLPFGYTSFCEQEFISKELVIYNSSTTFDLFKFPSCCVCKIKRTNK